MAQLPTRLCRTCATWAEGDGDACPQCGGPLSAVTWTAEDKGTLLTAHVSDPRRRHTPSDDQRRHGPQ